MKALFDGKVDNGKLIIYDQDALKRHYKQFEGNIVFISIEKAVRKRSTAQNKYLWGVVYKTIHTELGWDEEDAHDFCKKEFNPKFITLTNKNTGEIEERQIAGSTAKMTTTDFMEYVEKIQRFFAEHGVAIPDPNQTEFIDSEN